MKKLKALLSPSPQSRLRARRRVLLCSGVLTLLAVMLLTSSCAPRFRSKMNRGTYTLIDFVDLFVLGPLHVTSDPTGNYIVAGNGDHKLHVVCHSNTTTGPITGLCSHVQTGSAQTVISAAPTDPTGRASAIYTLAGNGYGVNSGDGIYMATTGDAAPGVSAALREPSSSAVDSYGNVLLVDYVYHTLRVVCMTNSGMCAKSTGTAIDPAGAQTPVLGKIYRVAGTAPGDYGLTGDGGPASSAKLNAPYYVATDSYNNIYIADKNNARIRLVCMTTSGPYCSSVLAGKVVQVGGAAATVGNIYTLAGGGALGDDNEASSAAMALPVGVAVDANSNVFIADYSANKIRIVCGSQLGFCSSIVSGKVLASGGLGTVTHIYTLAGTGGMGSDGDGAESIYAKLKPNSVSVDSHGNVVVADKTNAAVRIICVGTSGLCGKVDINTAQKVAPNGNLPATAYNIYQIQESQAGVPLTPNHAYIDSNDYVVVSDVNANTVRFTFGP